MIATLTFKTNDVMDQLPSCMDTDCARLQDDEDMECSCGCKALREFVSSKLRYDEYIDVTFDSDKKTATVNSR